MCSRFRISARAWMVFLGRGASPGMGVRMSRLGSEQLCRRWTLWKEELIGNGILGERMGSDRVLVWILDVSVQKEDKSGVFPLSVRLLGTSNDGGLGMFLQPKLRFGAGCEMVAEILTAENEATRSSKEQVWCLLVKHSQGFCKSGNL